MDLVGPLIARVFAAIIAIPLLAIVVASVMAARRTRAVTREGELQMRYSRPMQICGFVFAVFAPLAVCVPILLFPFKNPSDPYAAAGVLLFLLLLGGWLLLETRFVLVTVSDKGITYHSPWRRDVAYTWDDIVEISTFSYMYPLVFRGRDGRKFTIGMVMTGVSELVRRICKHLDSRVYAKARRGILWSLSPSPWHLVPDAAIPAGRTDDMNIALPLGRKVEELVEFVIQAGLAGTPDQETEYLLTAEFSLSPEDAELARDRTYGGIVRAATGNSANCPQRDKDPIAWESFQRARRDRSIITRIYPQFEREK